MKQEQSTPSEARSSPLKSTYNSTAIALILVVALLLALLLIFWRW